VAEFHWKGHGPEFHTVGMGRPWRLTLNAGEPGIVTADRGSAAKLLALQSVASIGRSSERAFGGATLVGFARLRGCVQATFSPSGGEGLDFIRE
jgi:hypothetical protein